MFETLQSLIFGESSETFILNQSVRHSWKNSEDGSYQICGIHNTKIEKFLEYLWELQQEDSF